ncbi:MAG TPA: murein biosynthesis integral membrane protein MurJ [Opitutaceae bacterium]|nr:murein biosynthesis integral membrane protein MurJ [Opitutaceae bacterium]
MSKSLERIGVVAGSTTLSRVLGLARDSLTAAVFGTTLWNSAFQFAFMLPNLFRRLLAEGQLNAALVPTLADALENGGKPAAFALLNKVFTWLLVATILLSVIAIILLGGAHWIPGLDERHVLGARLSQVLFPYLVFVSLAAAMSAVLQLLGNFSIPALTAVWLNISVIAALGAGGFYFADTMAGKMAWLCGGVLVGGILQLLIPWRALRREGWHLKLDSQSSDQLRQILRLMAPGVIGTAIYQINFLVSRSLAFSLDEASVTVLTLANRIMEVPQGIFTVSVATVIFPLMATFAARREMENFKSAYLRGMRLILVVTIPAAAGLALLSTPIVRLAFQWGAFTAHDTLITAPILAIYAVGLPFYSTVTQTIRGCYALKDTASPVRAAAVAFVVNLVASIVLMRQFGTAGLAWASNIAIAVQAVLLERALARKVDGLRFSMLFPSIAKIAAASALMTVVVGGSVIAIRATGIAGRTADLITVVAVIPAAIAVYAAILWILRIEDREEIAGFAWSIAARFGIKRKGRAP